MIDYILLFHHINKVIFRQSLCFAWFRDIKLKQGRMCHGVEKKMALWLIEVTRTKFKVNHVEVNNIFRVSCGVLFYPSPPPTYFFLAPGTEKTLAKSWISLNASIDCASLWCRSDESNWIFLLPSPLSTHRDCSSLDSMVLSYLTLFIVEPWSAWNHNFNLFPFKSSE